MMVMRRSFLLLIVPAVALADASPPSPAPDPAAAPSPPVAVSVGGVAVRVFFGADERIHVRAPGHPDLTLVPAGRAYLGAPERTFKVALVGTAVTGVPLLRISSRPEACSDYWDDYVSIAGGAPHVVLELAGVADPPAFSEPSVKFDAAAGTAVVTTRVTEDEGARPRVTRRRYRWNGTAFVPLSKRAAAASK